MGKRVNKNAFSKHAAPYLSKALKEAAKTYRRGKRPRPALIKVLQKKRDDLNRRIREEKQRGKML